MEKIASDVWLLRGGLPRKVMNAYLIDEGESLTLFDSGVKQMSGQIVKAVEASGKKLGKIVLGHAHPDHRGSARIVAEKTAAPVYCHELECRDAESDGGWHYYDFSKLPFYSRSAMKRLLKSWDAGPVKIAETLKEGDQIADFKVYHLPGHAPGQIALLRESDGLCLATDVLYTINPNLGINSKPHTPPVAYNQYTEMAKESIRRLAELKPSSVWLGHGRPITEDVGNSLLEAAARD